MPNDDAVSVSLPVKYFDFDLHRLEEENKFDISALFPYWSIVFLMLQNVYVHNGAELDCARPHAAAEEIRGNKGLPVRSPISLIFLPTYPFVGLSWNPRRRLSHAFLLSFCGSIDRSFTSFCFIATARPRGSRGSPRSCLTLLVVATTPLSRRALALKKLSI